MKPKLIFIILLLSIAVISTTIFSSSKNIAYAHTFSGDENASFLTLIEEISTISHLIEEELINNATLAQRFAEHISQLVTPENFKEISEKNKLVAKSLNESLADLENSFNFTNNKIVPSSDEIKEKIKNLDDILGEVVSVRIENEQLTNNTVNALVLNDLIGKALQSYGKALGIKSDERSKEHESEHIEENDEEKEDHKQVSIPSLSLSNSVINIALIDSTKNQYTSNKNITKVKIVNQVEYQIAQELFNKSIEKFSELKPLVSSNMSNLSTILESSLVKLKNAVDNKESFQVIDDIIDKQVTPHLESIIKIKIEEE